MGKNNLIQLMKEKAAGVGTIVHEISCVSEAIKYAVDLNRKKKIENPDLSRSGSKRQGFITGFVQIFRHEFIKRTP